MYQPLVSIIIPVYNGANYVKESIESALNQTYENIEVLVIDDGSDDNGATQDIAEKYGDEIKYIRKQNGGVSSALNLGLQKMNGDWFSWLSHDDLYYPNKIQEQVNIISNYDQPNVIPFTYSELIDSKGNIIGLHRNKLKKGIYTGEDFYKLLLQGFNPYGCSLLIPKKALIKADYFNEDFKYIQDWVMWVLLSLLDYNFICIDKKLVQQRIHREQQTLKISNLRIKELKIFGNDLLDYLSKDIRKNKDKIRVFIFWAIRNREFHLVKMAINYLESANKLGFRNKLKILTYIPYSRLSNSLKSILKKVVNNARRER